MPLIEEVLRKKLTTDEQYAAATDPAREILCLACAGSGKSRTLAYRIARLLADEEAPQGIVAFTFTEKAADSIKRRVAEALTEAGISPTLLGAMYIGTIHAYCRNVLGEMNARYRQFDVLDENRLKLYLMSRYPQIGLQNIRMAHNARYFDTIKEVAYAWSVMNDEMVSIEEIAAHDPQIGDILDKIKNLLDGDEFIDFSLMIRLVVDALHRNDPGAERAVANLRHLMVDEYQDINPAQEALIRELHRRIQTLFVVGDDDQSIYSWRGADVSNILTFQDRYPDCNSYTLSFNFRSTQAIVATADQFVVAELGANRIAKSPQASDPPGPRDFRNLWFDTREDEAEWVTERIGQLLGTAYIERNDQVRGLTLGDFAILMKSTRSNEANKQPRHAAFTQSIVNRFGPDAYTLEAGGSPFDRPQVRVLQQTFELLRDRNPSRQTARTYFEQYVQPAFPRSDFNIFTNVLADWGRRIHAPVAGGARRRVYPQQLVHDLLKSFGLAQSAFNEDTMRALGLFSRMILDVETVYLSVDSTRRFQNILNFLSRVAESSYNMSTDAVLRKPDAITVSTVHKAKGLEYPVVFVVDVENQRFPGRRGNYRGWLPQEILQTALHRGAYQNTLEGEIRLFYTAITRAERYLYVTGSRKLPGGKKYWKPSRFTQRFQHTEISNDPNGVPATLVSHSQIRRIDETIVPTTYSQIRYYLQCPRNYQFRESYGFSPPIVETFGFGTTVHTSIGRLHEVFNVHSPTREEAEELARDNFHLKHAPQSRNPEVNPGPYERAQESAAKIVGDYAETFADDFSRRRQVEVRFEIPVKQAVISGAIDLLLKEDDSGYIVDACVVDFKTIEGGEDPEGNKMIHWTELAMQVQLYAKAARDVLNENACTGAIHMLKNNRRVEVPVTDAAIEAAIRNIEWAVDRIIAGDFPMRPHHEKCDKCDFKALCRKIPQHFATTETPPPLFIPGPDGVRMARAFSEFEE